MPASNVRKLKRAEQQEPETVTLTYREVIDSADALATLMRNRLPHANSRQQLELGRLWKAIAAEHALYDEARHRLCQKHGGVLNPVTKKYEGMDEVAANIDYEELVKENAAPIAVPSIPFDAFEGHSLTPFQQLHLDWLIKE